MAMLLRPKKKGRRLAYLARRRCVFSFSHTLCNVRVKQRASSRNSKVDNIFLAHTASKGGKGIITYRLLLFLPRPARGHTWNGMAPARDKTREGRCRNGNGGGVFDLHKLHLPFLPHIYAPGQEGKKECLLLLAKVDLSCLASSFSSSEFTRWLWLCFFAPLSLGRARRKKG